MQGRGQPGSQKNGAGVAARPLMSSFAAAGDASSAPYDDPMSKVLGLDAKTSGAAAWFGFTSGSTLLMVALMAAISLVAWMHRVQAEAASTPDEIDVMRDEPPPPPPAPPPEEPAPKPEPAAPPPRAREAPPPPTPAQAAKVLTQEPDPNEPVDLTANTIVQGNADNYAGGFTASNGTNANAVRALPAATGSPTGTAPARAPVLVGPDKARTASLGSGDEWNCQFPEESNSAQIDEAYVTLQVDVRADGTAAAVRVVSDPGNGFGREAKRYALTLHYQTALDHEGNPIAGTTKIFRVHFTR